MRRAVADGTKRIINIGSCAGEIGYAYPAQAARVAERIPRGRMGHPEEVAAAAYITAETIRVDGGQTAIGAVGSPKKVEGTDRANPAGPWIRGGRSP